MAEARRVTVVGGGSSGMMAAISAARGGAEVTLLERKDRVGKKLLATGNGRCNLTNTDALPVPVPRRRPRLHRRGPVPLPGRPAPSISSRSSASPASPRKRGGSIPIPARPRRCWTSCAGNWSGCRSTCAPATRSGRSSAGESGFALQLAAGGELAAAARGPGLRRHGRAAVRQRRLGAAPGARRWGTAWSSPWRRWSPCACAPTSCAS